MTSKDDLGPEAVIPKELCYLSIDEFKFKQEARYVFELLSLPVLQVLAAGLNFAVVVIMGRPTFTLPFKNLDQVMAGTPLFSGVAKPAVPGGAQ